MKDHCWRCGMKIEWPYEPHQVDDCIIALGKAATELQGIKGDSK